MRDCMCRGARASAMQTHHDILDTPVELDSAMEAHAEQETAPVAQPSAKTQAKTQVQAENNAQVVFAAAEQALAEGVGFEPTVPLQARRFSRPVP